MRRIVYVFLLLVFAQAAMAQSLVPSLDGESFTKTFIGRPPNGDKLVEYIRESETFANWTKLIGYRYQKLPKLDNDPRQVATAMAEMLKTKNPKAQLRIMHNDKAGEAIIDFLTWPRDGAFLEFNVFRYARSADGKAVISLQFAHRMNDATRENVEKFRALRESWLSQSAAFDLGRVQAEMAR